jgi:hypothetical protein
MVATAFGWQCVPLLFFKHKIYCPDKEEKGYQVVPAEWFFQKGNRENAEYGEGNDFLYGFQLEAAESFLGAITVGRHHKAVFKESDAPADKDHFPERYVLMFEMAIPGKGHKGVGNGEEENGAHE